MQRLIQRAQPLIEAASGCLRALEPPPCEAHMRTRRDAALGGSAWGHCEAAAVGAAGGGTIVIRSTLNPCLTSPLRPRGS